MDDPPPPIATDADTEVSEGSATPARLARFHLDPVGGIAGDMFAAAVLDARPGLADGLRATLADLNLPPSIEIAIDPHKDAALAGVRFKVTAPADDAHGHVRLAQVRMRLEAARIEVGVRQRALAIFTLLAEAEGAVHGMDPAEVTFHEVGAWDATVDIVAAAYLIEALGQARWSVGSVPLGSGRVRCAHGLLPVPAPAVVHLLRGLATHDDGIEGERVTPTGAAILKHLAPDLTPAREPETLVGTGTGFGSRTLPGLSNVLRVLEFAPVAPVAVQEQVAMLRFEIDDQTPEDLALGLDRLRSHPDILDVVQWPAYGKKGRMVAAVQVLAEAGALDAALDAVFDETTTLGVRWSKIARSALTRETARHSDALGTVRVKRAHRPAGTVTAKAELDDLSSSAGHAVREERRRAAESAALRQGGND
ncbi:MAG: LarC family nickel insertion protein [Rhodospirillales bacterium]|nr:LarC family nickel insertion protein [Rhodospirillales bacterium]